jgi:hypothetical protein
MDYNAILTELIIGIIGLVLSAIGAIVAVLINKYVANEKLKTTLASFHDLVRNSVLETYQKYVEELKDKNMFDANAQKTALSACLSIIKANMPQRVETWLKSNVSNVEAYLISNIEAQIGELKNSGK